MVKTFPSLLALLLLLIGSGEARAQAVSLTGNADRATLRAALNYQSLQPGQQAVIAVVMEIKPGFHAQSHKPLDENLIPFEILPTKIDALTLYEPLYPEGHIEDYPLLGKVSVYSNQLVVYLPIEVKRDAPPGALKITGEVSYQICDDKACYPPERKPFTVGTTIVAPGQPVEANEPELFKNFDPATFARLSPIQEKRQEVKLFGYVLSDQSYVLAFIAAFLVGIIFNVMPCVLPVVPLKAMGFYQVAEKNRAKSIALGAIFSLGLVATFAVFGIFVVVLKTLAWGELFGNPWFLGAIVLLLAIFAFSMFGLFTVNLPTNVYRFTPRHDTYAGNFLFGIFTAILSTPCTFGMFLGLLIWATYQPWQIGLSLVMMVGLGMAFPYFLLSAMPEVAKKMPRTGPWAELIKQMMGFLLLASAIYFARRFIEAWIGADAYWWALFAIVLAAGLFLIVRTVQFSPRLVPRIAAIILAVILIAPAGVFAYRITNPPIDWVMYTPEKLAEAQSSGKPVMVEFTAAWCGNCLALEGTVFHDERVVKSLKEKNVIPIRVDLTRRDAPGWALLKKISPVGAIPLTAIYHPGAESPTQLAGLYNTEDLINALK